ncbi:putative penicillin-binding protein [Aspergillus affinis]|uniref:putative penicillin-binding protein n=1 Tax=Aspergillus affinis TaxID=1070780 RepID=UPI0022FF424E|nr:putative penicillin-binding protein [Aspergillus affinis]KAI9035300.1 putative penicillin-binding protein [Aspergillus affinis]
MASKTEDLNNPLDEEFAALVKQPLDRWHVPGMAVAVVDGADTWTEGYGGPIASLRGYPGHVVLYRKHDQSLYGCCAFAAGG